MSSRSTPRRSTSRRAESKQRSDRLGAPPAETDVEPGPDADPDSVARAIVLRRLSGAPQTRSQLDDAMAAKDVPDDVRARVLDRFTDVGLIDDAAYAQAWVESRHTGRGLARRALADELRRRGVAAEVAGEAVEAVSGEREEATARALVAKRLPATRRLEPAARTRRLVSLLARKGYPAGLAYRVVRDALEAEGLADAGIDAEPEAEVMRDALDTP